MFKWIVVGLALLMPCIAQAQNPPASPSPADLAAACVKVDENPPTPPPHGKKVKKSKQPKDKLVPLSLVVCEVEKALDAYEQSPEVRNEPEMNIPPQDVLPHIVSADFDFKTAVDWKGTAGIGFYIFKLGGSYDKQTTNEVDFQYVPKSLLRGHGFATPLATVSFQEELLKTIKSAAKAIKEEQAKPIPISEKDPLVFKQLSVTVGYGVTWDVNGGITLPIDIVTLTAQLDRSKNSVLSVKLVFAPPTNPGEKP